MGHEGAFPPPRLSARCSTVNGPSQGRGATGEKRRFRTFPPSPRNVEVRLEAAITDFRPSGDNGPGAYPSARITRKIEEELNKKGPCHAINAGPL